MWKPKTTSPLLIALVVSGCLKPVGDFCDIAEPIHFTRSTAQVVVSQNRDSAELIDTQNRYGERFCGWPKPH